MIVAFQGNPVHEVKDLTKAVRKANPGDEVAVTVLRDGKRQDLKVTLGERDDRHVIVLRRGGGDDNTFTWSDEDAASRGPRPVEKRIEIRSPHEQGGYLGIGMQDLTEQLGEHFGVEDGKGVLVSEVKPDTPAARAGLEAGDVIVKAGDKDVADASELREALADTKAGDEVALAVVRDGTPPDRRRRRSPIGPRARRTPHRPWKHLRRRPAATARVHASRGMRASTRDARHARRRRRRRRAARARSTGCARNSMSCGRN